MMLRELISLFFLTNTSYSDIKERRVSLFTILLFFGMGIICNIFEMPKNMSDIMVGLIPGIIMCILSLISRGRLGMGDALVVLVLGIFYECAQVFEILIFSIFLSAIYSAVMLLLRKKGIKDEFPFIPFLLAAYVVSLAGSQVCRL